MNSLEKCFERICRRFAYYLETFFEDGIAVWGKIDTKPFDIVVKPKDIDGYYINEVKVSSIAPEEEASKIDIGLRLFAANAISCYTLLKNFVGMEDPLAESTQQLIESVLNNPQIQDILAQIVQQHPEFKAQIEQIIGQQNPMLPQGQPQIAPPNPLGNQGNPPSPMQSGAPPMSQVPVMAGSPEEQNLVARQATAGNTGTKLAPRPSMYNMNQ